MNVLSESIGAIFRFKKNGTTLSREIVAGITTFAAMSYILAVNPSILSAAGMDKPTLVTVTALAAAVGCLLMACLSNLPIAVAPAMGTNSYFAFIICIGMGLDWKKALALTFYNGIIFFLISITGLREKLVKAVPHPLQVGLQSGIGLFIAFLGLQSAGLVVADKNTLVGMGNLDSNECLFALSGIALMSILLCKKFKAAIISTILLLTVVAFFVDGANGNKIATMPTSVFSIPHNIDATFLQLDLFWPIEHFNDACDIIFILLLLDMFDTIGTVIAMGRASGLMDKSGNMKNMGGALTADACATIAGSLLGTSTTGAYVESAAGIESGGRTGFTAIIVAVCFICSLFISPLINAIPSVATSPALVMVGIMMMKGFGDLKFGDLAELIPSCFCTMMIALSFRVSEGFAFGLIAYVLIMLFTKRGRCILPSTWILFILMCVFLTMLK